DGVLTVVDHVAAGFGRLAVGEAVADGPYASAGAASRVDHGDAGAERHQVAGGGEPRKSGARHQNRHAAQVRHVISQLRNRVPLPLQHRQQTVRTDEMRGADDNEGAAGTGEERLDLREPVPVAGDEQTLIHLGVFGDVAQYDLLYGLDIARLPRGGKRIDA